MTSTAVNQLRLAGWCIALFVSAVYLYTRHNDFPWYYHPDEPGKVGQVLGWEKEENEDGTVTTKPRKWNFHHPMLLLTATKLAVQFTGATEPQDVVELGRLVAALFMATATVALSLLAYFWRGWPAGVAGGLALLFHHQLFELSHYMKEDPALLMGFAVTFLSAFRYERQPSLGAAFGLGAGCALAISGKYLGVISLGIAFPVLLRDRRHGTVTASTIAFVSILLAVNWPMLADPQTFLNSFARETKLVVEGQGQVTQRVPHTRYWSVFLANTTPVTWILLLFAIWSAVSRRRQLTLVEWMIVVFPFAYALALSFSPKENDRYFLPASAFFTVLAAAATVEVSRFAGERVPRNMAEIAAGVVLILAQFPSWTDDRGGLQRYYEAFQRDDTAELVAWLRETVPVSEAIAKDDKVRLPTRARHGKGPGADPLPHRIYSDRYLADLGSLDELRAAGVTHVIITKSTYGTFERVGFRPKQNAAADYERRRLFYLILKRDYEPVKVWRRSTVLYLHPGLEVYRIVPAR